METIILGILILLALCGSRAAGRALSALVLLPLAVFFGFILVVSLISGGQALITWVTTPAKPPVIEWPRSPELVEIDDDYHAGVTLYALRARYGITALP
jgi:hypothetical protein